MRQIFLYLLVAAVTLCSIESVCGSAERKPSARTLSAFRSDTVDLATLKTALGPSFETTTTEHFVLLHEAGAGYVAETGKTLETAYKQFYEAFSLAGFDLSRSQSCLIWICFPQKSGFNNYAMQVEKMDLSWLEGYYSTLTNRVAIVQKNHKTPENEKVNTSSNGMRVTLAANEQSAEVLPIPTEGQQLDIARLTHELAHQLAFNSGLQKRGVMYPLWVSEGLATNFEYERPASTGLERCNVVRCNSLVESHTAGKLVPLQQFVVQTKTPADTRVSRRHYAQAWAFFHFIMTERPRELRNYLRRLAGQTPGRRDAGTLLTEFTEAFGSPEELEPAWKAFLDRQAQHALAGSPAASLTPDKRVAQ